jgi:hypothetical protein
MLWQASITATVLLACQALIPSVAAFPTAEGLDFFVPQRRDEGIHERLRRALDNIGGDIERRQAPTPASGNAMLFNSTAWNNLTESLCQKQLSTLNGQATNPSGMAVCYNLPFLDNTTGVFQADLRMYRISPPTGDWTGVDSGQVNVGLSYIGATVSATMDGLSKRDFGMALSWPAIKRMIKRQAASNSGSATPEELQIFNYVGQVNKNLMRPNMPTSELENLLIPSITLTATNPQGQQVNTSLSSKEASFVNGVFANGTTPTSPQAVASASAAAIRAAFVLPGTKISIFPIGLIITASWTLLLVSAVGYGTFGRYMFREQYRRRMRRGIGLAGKPI